MAQDSRNRDSAEGSGCQSQEGLVLCSNNCGFLGCAATMNLCAKCYRELISKKQGGKSEISTISPSSNTSPVLLSPVGAEKSFSKSPFSLSLPASAEPIQHQMAFLTATVANSSVTMESLNSSNSLFSTKRSFTADLATITSLISSESSYGKAVQPPARRHGINRCLTCKRRIGLLAIKCRCGNLFCTSHRYSDKHGCSFDYKAAGREAIAKANPMVVAKKVERI